LKWRYITKQCRTVVTVNVL